MLNFMPSALAISVENSQKSLGRSINYLNTAKGRGVSKMLTAGHMREGGSREHFEFLKTSILNQLKVQFEIKSLLVIRDSHMRIELTKEVRTVCL